jgi:hypothetical protein
MQDHQDYAGLTGAEPPVWRRVMQQHIIYVGLDVHKDTIGTSPESGKRGEVRKHREVLNNLSRSSGA